MRKPTGDNCWQCRYSADLPEDDLMHEKRLLCQRFPPQVITGPSYRFPIVGLTDWCGEFRSDKESVK